MRPPLRKKRSLDRVRLGASMLGGVVVLAAAGFHFWGGYHWIEAIWLVVVTVSTVGFGEKSGLPPHMQIFTAAVILIGVTAGAYTFGAFMQMAIEGELEDQLGQRRMTRDIKQLKNHVVLCGFGSSGELLANTLIGQNVAFVVVDHDAVRIDDARSKGFLVVHGDATDDDVLRLAGIVDATSLITNLPNDAENVFITLTARNLRPDLNIVARAEQPSTEKKLRQAGANRIVMPAVSGARLMARMVTRPTTAELMELVTESTFHDMELDEIIVTVGSRLVGMDVRSTEAHRKHRLLVVAVKQRDGSMQFNPDADYCFQDDDTVILMGRTEDIQRFRLQYNTPE